MRNRDFDVMKGFGILAIIAEHSSLPIQYLDLFMCDICPTVILKRFELIKIILS